MPHPSEDELLDRLAKKITDRPKVKRRMKVSGAGVKHLVKLIKERGEIKR